MLGPFVTGVFVSSQHSFSKEPRHQVTLVKGHGVEGDAHAGVFDQHLFHARRDPRLPNLRQVHLLQAELLDELSTKGFSVQPGELGENISTRGLDLLSLPRATRLRIGSTAIVEIAGLRSCCIQIDKFRPGMLKHIIEKQDRKLVRKGGVMGVVAEGGIVSIDDAIAVTLPAEPFEVLHVV